MYVIYHDPGCIFSVICLAVMRAKKVSYDKVKYKKEPLTADTIRQLVKKLGVKASDLVCKKDKCWKSTYSKLELGEEEIIKLLIEQPKLMIRPIIVNEDKAIVGRPPVSLLKLIKEQEENKVV